MLFHSPVHAGAPDGVDYDGGENREEPKTLARFLACLVAADGSSV